MAKKWCRAVWKEDQQEEEGVIPSMWIIGGKVMWPSWTKNVSKIMQEGRKPDSKWEQFKLLKIKYKSDNKKECEVYDDTTTAEVSDGDDEDDDTQELSKRVSKKKEYTDFVVDDNDQQATQQQVAQKNQCRFKGKKKDDDNTHKTKQLHIQRLPTPPPPPSNINERNQDADHTQKTKSTQKQLSHPPSFRSERNQGSQVSSDEETVISDHHASSKRSRSPIRPSSVKRTASSRRSGSHRRTFSRSPSPKSKASRRLISQSPIESYRTDWSRRSRSRSPIKSTMSASSRRSRSRSPLEYGRTMACRQSESRSYYRERSRSIPSSSRRPRSRSISPMRSYSKGTKNSTHRESRRSRSLSPLRYNSKRNRSDHADAMETIRPKSSDRAKTDETFPMSEGRFQRRVLYLLSEMRDLLKHGDRPTIEMDDDDGLQQAETRAEFGAFDEELNDKKRYTVVKNMITRIGGSDCGDHIKKAMQRCMTNKAMSEMNLSGAKSKYSFGNSNLYKIIKEVILQKYKESTEKQIGDKVATYLKFAPERSGGGGRKSIGEKDRRDKNKN